MLRNKLRYSALALPLVLAALALVGCSAPAPAATNSAANDKAAAKFVACLNDQGQTAKILDTGQVGLLQPDVATSDDGTFTTDGNGDDQPSGDTPTMVSMIKDDDGTWLASNTAVGYPDEGGQRDAWAACQAKVPEFTQPAADMGDADVQKVTAEDALKASLAFAKCARDNGFADFADPGKNAQLTFPDGITEDEFRSLFEACASKLDGGVPISKESIDGFQFDWMSIVQEYVKGGGQKVAQVGGGN
jgi:hypothetical protein